MVLIMDSANEATPEEASTGKEPSLPATAALLYDEYQTLLQKHHTSQSMTAADLLETLIAPPPGADLPEQLRQVAILKSWLDSFRPLPRAVVAELRQLYTVRLTYNSNAIEGNTLTQSETEMVLSHGVTIGGKTLVEHLEVIGHRDAMEYMEELAGQETPIGEWEIRSLHSLIVRGLDQMAGTSEAGKYRTLDVRAAGTEHIYPPHFQLPELMENFIRWLNAETAKAMPPPCYAAEAHYRLVSIHPFRDGNGRTARLLMNLLLLRAGYTLAVIPNTQRARYLEALVYAQSHNDDTNQLTTLVVEACCTSLIEYLRLLSTAGESRGRGLLFYHDILKIFRQPGA